MASPDPGAASRRQSAASSSSSARSTISEPGLAEDRVRVFVRVKPPKAAAAPPSSPTGRSLSGRSNLVVSTDPAAKQVTVFEEKDVISSRASAQKVFTFDGVFGPETTQDEVFTAIGQPVLEGVLNGFDGTILAYGQTNSGKTYSLLNGGDADINEAGLVPRLATQLFLSIALSSGLSSFTVQLAFCQIYNEQIDDLLSQGSGSLRLRDLRDGLPELQTFASPPQLGRRSSVGSPPPVRTTPDKGGCEVEGLTWVDCPSPEALLQHFNDGRLNLRAAETRMNRLSSRSHAVLMLRVVRKTALAPSLESEASDSGAAPEASDNGGEPEVACEVTVARLLVVDMAGSERVKRAGSEGIRFEEARNINTSLLCFGNVVSALAAKQRHVPFRDSKLTRLLENCVGGRCNTVLLVCVSAQAEDAGDTVGSLELGARALRVEQQAHQNRATIVVDSKALAHDLAQTFKERALEQGREQTAKLERSLQQANFKLAMLEAALEAQTKEADQKREEEAARLEAERQRADSAEASAQEAALASSTSSTRAESAETKCADLAGAVEELRTRSEVAAAKAAEVAALQASKLQKLAEELAAMTKAWEAVSGELKLAVERLGVVEKEKRELEQRAASAEALHRETALVFERERATWQEEAAQLRARVGALESDLESSRVVAEAKYGSLELQHSGLQAEHSGLQQEHLALKRRYSQLELEAEEQASCSTALQEESRRQLAEAEKRGLELEERYRELEGQHSRLEGRCRGVEGECERLREKCAEQGAESAAKSAAALAKERQLQEEAAGYRSALTSAQAELAALRDEVTSAHAELVSVQDELTSAHTELMSAQAELATERGELTSARDEVAALREELGSARARGETAVSGETQVRGELREAEQKYCQEIDRLQAALAAESASHQADVDRFRRQALQRGLVCTKFGTNGKPYRRLVRVTSAETEKGNVGCWLEWAKVGTFKKGAAVDSATVCAMSQADKGGVLRKVSVAALDRQNGVTLEMDEAGEAAEWQQALADLLMQSISPASSVSSPVSPFLLPQSPACGETPSAERSEYVRKHALGGGV